MMRKLYAHICAAEVFVAAIFLMLMVVLIFLGGVMRMLGQPINWAGDAATAFFAWACFLCADIAWRNNSLMAVEVLVDRLPERLRRACTFLNLALITAFLVFLIVFGAYLAWISRVRSFQGIPSVSYSWVTASLPAGAALLLITTLLKVRRIWRGEHEDIRATDVL